ncbi:MAG: universal stress protein [Gomphosphaeria aponina SAG 52.96 = DSM 107014]|uniref:Universal stress protein n=1 Tax=Gomphosphaeria aponina SAG 52.96 = DSM 107014 TaxID=1521640 RepID=A0A941GR11_9CHRO|nr:universal stress protein [Gomphosphaeria aponina SAG 52.96 = DSM 107014]
MFQRALICTNFEDGLNRLVDFVPFLAKGGLKKIVFLHCVSLWAEGTIPREDSAKITEGKKRLHNALKNVPEGVEVFVEVVSGAPLEIIPRILNNFQIDVILLGAHIRSSLEDKIFGSTSTGLAKLTELPLMVFRPELISTYTEEELALRCQHLWREILIPYNDSSTAHYLIARIKEYAMHKPFNSFERCRLIWVIEEKGGREAIADYFVDDAHKKLVAVQKELEQLNLQVDVEVRRGDSLPEIIAAATDFDTSAIAIASETRKNLLELTLKSFSFELLHKSWFPLLFFSPKK